MLNPTIREQLRAQGFSIDGSFAGASPVDRGRMENMQRIRKAHRSETVPLADNFEPGFPDLWEKVASPYLHSQDSETPQSSGRLDVGNTAFSPLYLSISYLLALAPDRYWEAWFLGLVGAFTARHCALTKKGSAQWSVPWLDLELECPVSKAGCPVHCQIWPSKAAIFFRDCVFGLEITAV